MFTFERLWIHVYNVPVHSITLKHPSDFGKTLLTLPQKTIRLHCILRPITKTIRCFFTLRKTQKEKPSSRMYGKNRRLKLLNY